MASWRLIPARAGKTLGRSRRSFPRRAHPRAGGENGRVDPQGRAVVGSSPRGRGKQDRDMRDLGARRLIPARAGKTRGVPGGCQRGRAHPRAGGENPGGHSRQSRRIGSSPRGRGKRRACTRRKSWQRLIPARAGKTMELSAMMPMRSAHPRAGGENIAVIDAAVALIGSSPRGRGKPSSSPSKNSANQAHPRAGGENDGVVEVSPGSAGSSPRGRGKPWSQPKTPASLRLIPARAGKTSAYYASLPLLKAHPRAGGENHAT